MSPPPALQLASSPVHPVIREVTEDTPADLLEGTMDLLVVLPSTKSVRMTVNRRTPMMDLLIQVATINKINPGDHIAQVRNERGIELPYKPSTPIGALDTTTIEIVPKNRVNEYIIVKKPAKLANQPFEQTFRLQVHLPRNQLYVMRVSPRTLLEDILKEVCQEKNLDLQKYEIRHPANLNEKLPLTNSLSDFGLTEVTVVSKNTKINSSVSAADIMAMQQTEEGRNKYMDSSFKHSRSSVGDSSVSSGSTGSARGVSPTRSDDSRSVSPLPHNNSKIKLNHRTSTLSSCSSGITPSVQKSLSMSNMNSPSGKTESLPPGIKAPPRTKKRAAPLPPMLVKSQTESILSTSSISMAEQINSQTPTKPTPRKKAAPRLPPKANSVDFSAHNEPLPNHSRHSSGSSGYHESSILSDQHETHRFDRQISAPAMFSKQGTTARSTSNLTTVSSVSSTSLASSTGGSKKRRAPPPPAVITFKPQSEIEEEDSEASSVSHGLHSSKSDRSRQSSLEVEVEVHHTPLGRRNSTDHSSSTPISVNDVKDMEILSSSPSSSLSSPGSSSGSTSSSPLPSTESPSSKPSMNKGSQPSSNNVPSNSSSSKYYPPVDEPGNNFPDHGRSSPAIAGSAQAAAPLPPPRTKTRENLLSPTSEDPKSQPEPKPRPKPRPDRVSVDNLIAENQTIIRPKPVETSPPEPAPASSSQLRNPLARYGVKVLPDNVVKERADRLAKKASEELSESGDIDLDTIKFPKKTVAPVPPNTNRDNPSKQGVTPKPDYQKKYSDSSSSSSTKSKPAPTLPKSDYTGKESVRSIKSLNEKLLIEKSKLKKERRSQELSTEYDSDDLEENLSFFEPSPILRKTSSDSRLVDKHSAEKLSSIPTKSHFDKQKSSILSRNSEETVDKALPKPKDKSDVTRKESDGGVRKSRISASVSGLEDLEKEETDSLSERVTDFDSVGFNRTYSDRLKSKGGLKTSETTSSDGKQLNRWQNFESLNEIDDQSQTTASNKNATKTNTNKISSKVPTLSNTSNSAQNQHLLYTKKSGRSSSEDFHEDAHIQTAHEDNDEDAINSSESEVSYTDSGIPATEPVTPSPMDFDSRISEHEDDGRKSRENYNTEKELMSGGSSPRSSFHSSDGDQWRSVMEAKTIQTQETREQTFASMIPDSLTEDHKSSTDVSDVTKTSGKRNDDKSDSNQGSDSGAEDGEGHISTSEGELIDDELKDNNKTSRIVPTRKLSKSESFSHNSEFDIIEMKRKKFATGHGSKTNNNKRGSSTTDLRSSSNHSSSEEDLRSTMPPERNKKNHSLGTSSENKGNRATSMHNLTSNNSGQVNRNSLQKTTGDDNQIDGYITVQKATSMMEIQKLDSDNSNSPDIMKQFHSQLEAQFEQWKQDFLTKHLTEAQISDKNAQENKSDFQVERNNSILKNIDTTDSGTLSLETPSVTVKPQEQSEDVKYPQYNQTIKGTQLESRSSSQNQAHTDYDEPSALAERFPVIKAKAAISQSQTSEVSESGKEGDQETEMISQKKEVKSASQPAYRYSGPPTINMSSWSDRKRTTTVTVKKDKDYIMGFGQLDSKANSVESKPFIGSKGLSTPTNISLSSPEQPVVPAVSVIKSMSPLINKSSSPVTSSPNRGLSAALNARPTSSENTEATGNVRSVLSSWKQRVELSEKERNTNQGPPPEIDIYGSEPLPIKRPDSGHEHHHTVLEISKPEKIDSPRANVKSAEVIVNRFNQLTTNVDPEIKESSPAEQKINLYNQDGLKRHESLVQHKTPPVIVEIDRSNSIKSKTVKPMQFKISTMESQNVSRVQSFKENKEVDIIDGNENEIPVSSPDNQNGPSLQERKNFFQGVKPVVNGKEAPVPAVNMKSSIATIQKVFEHRQQQNENQSTVQRSMTLPTPSTKEAKPTIISQPETSSTIPKNFQAMSSNEMVQRVLGRPSGYNYETFRRSPSPVSSTTSTLSRTSSSGRGTPSSSATDVADNVVRISSEYKKSAPSPPSIIQNVGNKAIIIVNGSDRSLNDSETIPSRSVSNNIFKQQIGDNSSSSVKLKPTPSLTNSNRFKDNKNIESTKILINGNPTAKLSQPVIEIRDAPVIAKPVIVDQTVKESRKLSNTATPKITTMVPKRESIDASKLKPSTTPTNGPPPPPPPPSIEGLNLRPTGLNLHGKLKSSTSLTNSPTSNPASPSSPDPRAEICNLIKNSNGNFGLKKTGSTFLLK